MDTKKRILELTDQCVKCGMCLPSCPTYKLSNLEGHSPRGRIALWQHLINNKLSPTAKTFEYLDNCLNCGACVNNCPASVKYLELHNLGKNIVIKNNLRAKNKSLKKNIFNPSKIAITVFSNSIISYLSHYLLFIIQTLKLDLLVQKIVCVNNNAKQKFDSLYQYLPILNRPKYYKNTVFRAKPIDYAKSNPVILFTGCVNKLTDQTTISSAIRLLNKLGYDTHILKQLHCCGALLKHYGYIDEAKELYQANNHAIENLTGTNNILTVDTGCHEDIKQQFQNRQHISISNIEEFIYQSLATSTIHPQVDMDNIPTIYIYTPCSQRERLKNPELTKKLLAKFIPIEKIKSIASGYGCCGAAGTNMLDNPKQAQQFAQKIIDDFIATSKINNKTNNIIVVTSNVGCNLHLKQVLKKHYSLDLTIYHPVVFLDKLFKNIKISV